jgi:hypothetical protein
MGTFPAQPLSSISSLSLRLTATRTPSPQLQFKYGVATEQLWSAEAVGRAFCQQLTSPAHPPPSSPTHGGGRGERTQSDPTPPHSRTRVQTLHRPHPRVHAADRFLASILLSATPTLVHP